MTTDPYRIAKLITKQQTGILSEQEQHELDKWFGNPANRQWFEDFTARAEYDRKFGQLREIDWQSAYRTFRRKHSALTFRKVLRYAAVLFVPLAAGIFFLVRNISPEPSREKITAVIERSSGERIVLDEHTGIAPILPPNIQLDENGQGLVYTGEAAVEQIINRVSIPRGSQFRLQLPDGTSVHLNSGTVLEFPEQFSDGQREVMLWGEAWFEVTPDQDMPFIVTTDQMQVRVLGTRFNVNTFEKGMIYTALEEGSVEILSESLTQPRRMEAGQLATFETATGSLSVADANLGRYTGWREGLFVFSAEPMGSIMEKLARSYDIDITFADEALKNVRFSGHLQKNDDIRVILDALERTTSVSFVYNGNTIVVTQ